MAHKGMTVQEAAERIGISDRSLRSYISKGFLTVIRKRGDRKTYVDPLEVEEFIRDRDSANGKSIISKSEFLTMKAQIRRLEAQVDVLSRILDAKDNPLRMSSAYAKDLFSICRAQVHHTGWTPDELEPWVEIFLRVDENDFQTISAATEDPKPWRAFLQLCVSMTAYVVDHKDYATSLILQGLHKKLAEGRRRLRVSALIYSEMVGSADIDIRRYALADAPGSLTDAIKTSLKLNKK